MSRGSYGCPGTSVHHIQQPPGRAARPLPAHMHHSQHSQPAGTQQIQRLQAKIKVLLCTAVLQSANRSRSSKLGVMAVSTPGTNWCCRLRVDVHWQASTGRVSACLRNCHEYGHLVDLRANCQQAAEGGGILRRQRGPLRLRLLPARLSDGCMMSSSAGAVHSMVAGRRRCHLRSSCIPLARRSSRCCRACELPLKQQQVCSSFTETDVATSAGLLADVHQSRRPGHCNQLPSAGWPGA